MSNHAPSLLDDILALCERARMSHSAFGLKVANDPSLVSRIAGRTALGRRPAGSNLEHKIRVCMDSIAEAHRRDVEAQHALLPKEAGGRAHDQSIASPE